VSDRSFERDRALSRGPGRSGARAACGNVAPRLQTFGIEGVDPWTSHVRRTPSPVGGRTPYKPGAWCSTDLYSPHGIADALCLFDKRALSGGRRRARPPSQARALVVCCALRLHPRIGFGSCLHSARPPEQVGGGGPSGCLGAALLDGFTSPAARFFDDPGTMPAPRQAPNSPLLQAFVIPTP